MRKKLKVKQVKSFSPLDELKTGDRRTLIKETKILDVESGHLLFEEGDSEKRAFYVLSGSVELRVGDQVVTTITGGAEEARNPLAPELPRRYTALASDAVEYFSVDSDSLDTMLNPDPTEGEYDVSELRDEADKTGADEVPESSDEADQIGPEEVPESSDEADQTGAEEVPESSDEADQIGAEEVPESSDEADQTGADEVPEAEQTQYNVSQVRADAELTDTWTTALVRLKAFHKIPPDNIQGIFMRLEQVDAKAGDVVIRQGEQGDYFYVVTVGRCVVTRETSMSEEGIRLAELEVGDSFGEEALISGAKRNATVVMETDGTLMRLSKEDFHTLIKEPMLDWVDVDEANKIVAAGGRWLDVRGRSEFKADHENGAINMPFYAVRQKLETLDPLVKYVVYCDSGQRSAAAAFMLNEKDFQAYVLKGGLKRGGSDDQNVVTSLRGASSSQLALLIDDVVVKLFPLEKPVITIGRHQDNDIRIDNDFASNRHAQILVDPNEPLEGHKDIVLEDLGSTNGVLVNDKQVKRCQLKPNDEITIARKQFKLLDDSQADSETVTDHVLEG
jgi:CRP-like cAMP-binding protein